MHDLHMHMILDGVYYRTAIDAHRERPQDELIRARLADYRKRGTQFLRDGGDALGVSLRARELAWEYDIDYRTPAFPIYKKGHYGSFIGCGYDSFDDYRRLIDQVAAQKGNFVKLMLSGLIDFSQDHRLTGIGPAAEEICRLIDYAHEAGFSVMAHAHGDHAVNAALDAHVDSIEHGAFLSEHTLRRLADCRTLWVPTLSTIGNLIGSGRYPDALLRPLLAEQQEKVKKVAQWGGLVGLGSDAGAFQVYHGSALETEATYLSGIPTLTEAATFAKSRF